MNFLDSKTLSVHIYLMLFFWPFNVLACIGVIVGSLKLGSFISDKFDFQGDAVEIIFFVIGCFVAYQITKLTHIYPWSGEGDDDIKKTNEKNKGKEKDSLGKKIVGIFYDITDSLGISFLIPFALIFLVIWIIT